MSEPAIRIEGLRKTYGESVALDGVDLCVERGSVFGFLGPNGAGKTTTLRILTGLASATSGRATILGLPTGSLEARAAVGFLPDVPGFYGWMNAREFLRFSGGLFGIDAETLDERVAVLLELAGLTGVEGRVGGYSRGMRQRLGVAQALINAPQVLLLDEPTSALDPVGRKEVLDMVETLRGRTTVFFSTHILADVERVCDHVAILDRGRVVLEAPISEISARHGAHRIAIEVEGDIGPLAAELRGRDWVRALTQESPGSLSVTVADTDTAGREIPELVARNGLSLVRYGAGEIGLEEVFVELVGSGANSMGGAR